MVTLTYEQKESKFASVLCVELTFGEFEILLDAVTSYAESRECVSLTERRDACELALFMRDDEKKFDLARGEWLERRHA